MNAAMSNELNSGCELRCDLKNGCVTVRIEKWLRITVRTEKWLRKMPTNKCVKLLRIAVSCNSPSSKASYFQSSLWHIESY